MTVYFDVDNMYFPSRQTKTSLGLSNKKTSLLKEKIMLHNLKKTNPIQKMEVNGPPDDMQGN